ncbi:kilA domain protein [Escherichia coli EPEC C342-62]|nr:kilA domain protein [Escherichia coli EPEC C342-62]
MSILQPLCLLFVVLKLRPTALAVTTLMLYTERADSVPIKRQLNG